MFYKPSSFFKILVWIDVDFSHRFFQSKKLIEQGQLKEQILNALDLKAAHFVVFDLETTGLYADQGDEIIEVGAIRIKDLQIEKDHFQSLVKPSKPIPESSTAVHGISDVDVLNASPSTKVLPEFFSFMGSGIWVAQNASFDLSFILRDAEKMGISPPDRIVLDTMKISKILFPNAGTHNLDAIMARLEINKKGDRHRSLDDCRFTGLALIEMLKLLEKQGITQLTQLSGAFVRTENILRRPKPKAMGLFS